MNKKLKSVILFAVAGVLGLVASNFLIVQVVDATIVNLVVGFFSAAASLSVLSVGIANLIE
ncbi:MAG: hypothetical protein HYY67_02375 [Thaumarchaeota archaeon]|nr:hypothetical protein [Nitrososphaerota archaeon]